MNSHKTRALLAAAIVAVAVPAGSSLAGDAGPAAKPKLKGEAEGEVNHGPNQSDVNARAAASRRGGKPVEGATVSGELTEPDNDGAKVSAVIDGEDKAKTNAKGIANLTFTIDSYGEKRLELKFRKKGFRPTTKVYTFEVTAQEGQVFEP
jgi:hypothetical protein